MLEELRELKKKKERRRAVEKRTTRNLSMIYDYNNVIGENT